MFRSFTTVFREILYNKGGRYIVAFEEFRLHFSLAELLTEVSAEFSDYYEYINYVL